MQYTPDEVRFLQDRQAPVLAQMVEPESLFYWQAYHYLRGEGFDGMGAKPIPFRAVVEYASWAGVTCKVEQARLVKMVFAIDNAAREFAARRAET